MVWETASRAYQGHSLSMRTLRRLIICFLLSLPPEEAPGCLADGMGKGFLCTYILNHGNVLSMKVTTFKYLNG